MSAEKTGIVTVSPFGSCAFYKSQIKNYDPKADWRLQEQPAGRLSQRKTLHSAALTVLWSCTATNEQFEWYHVTMETL